MTYKSALERFIVEDPPTGSWPSYGGPVLADADAGDGGPLCRWQPRKRNLVIKGQTCLPAFLCGLDCGAHTTCVPLHKKA